jgi:spermidine synthase
VPLAKVREGALLANVGLVAICGLLYELICGTLASYLLGNTLVQFSLVLGNYLFALGVGAWGASFVGRKVNLRYVEAELALALVGGLSVPILLGTSAVHAPVLPVVHVIVFAIGVLVGIELPLLVALLREVSLASESEPESESESESKDASEVVAVALAVDYGGALLASLFFPLVLVPYLGLVKGAALAGAINAVAALSATFIVPLPKPAPFRVLGVLILLVLLALVARGELWLSSATD